MRLSFSILVLLFLTACIDQKESLETTIEKKISKTIQLTPSDFQLTSQERVCTANIRGLHMLDDKTGWASGSGGTILRLRDGINWQAQEVTGYTHLDFRDIHGFDDMTALAMAAGDEGRMIRTQDGGETWTEVYTNLEEGIFLDGVDFDGQIGYCIGDPIGGRPLILRSDDAGLTWVRAEPKTVGMGIRGEGSYAASGTTIVYTDEKAYAAYGGDSLIRVLHNKGPLYAWESVAVPLRIGEGCGVFSMAFKNKQKGVAVGGCYIDSLNTEGNCAITINAGKSWSAIMDFSPAGYRSCVAYTSSSDFYLCCGRTGIDLSTDDGRSWSAISEVGYYTCALADSSGWLMGRNGKMARINW